MQVYLISMLKFIGGPAFGTHYELSYLETIILTVLGMMTTVVIISYFGIRMRKWWLCKKKNRGKRFSKKNRRIITIWRNYGVFGVSFLTPVFFSPIIGTLVVTLLGGKRKQVLTYMLFSAIFWSVTISIVLDWLF